MDNENLVLIIARWLIIGFLAALAVGIIVDLVKETPEQPRVKAY